jgi:hypothetical protein
VQFMGRNTHLVEVYIESNEERPCLHAVLSVANRLMPAALIGVSKKAPVGRG